MDAVGHRSQAGWQVSVFIIRGDASTRAVTGLGPPIAKFTRRTARLSARRGAHRSSSEPNSTAAKANAVAAAGHDRHPRSSQPRPGAARTIVVAPRLPV
ncbi:MAG: hypothetical protein M1826_002754 [Phylliscum demangeonii]|nr:MAG: hypothetical protein M1826_002754 [Phylliscum demangeonii]